MLGIIFWGCNEVFFFTILHRYDLMAQATLSKEFQNSIEQSGKHKMMMI